MFLLPFRTLGLAALATFLVTAPVEASSAKRSSIPDAPRQAVERLLHRWSSEGAPGVTVSVTSNGSPTIQLAVGQANLEQRTLIGPNSAFETASLSKQFTAFAVLLLEQDGRLSIDDPVAKYLPEMARFRTITLRHLLTHTSGLRDGLTMLTAAGWREEDFFSNEQVLGMIFVQTRLNFVPGTAYQYNNSGYILLAEIVHRVSGRGLAEFCADRMFKPLGMTHTRFQNDIADIVPERVQSYRVRKGQYRREVLSSVLSGPTGLLTTIGDLNRWARNFETGAVGGQALLRRMEERPRLPGGETNFYAFGQEFHLYKGLRTWSHGGREAGFRSFLLRIPDEKFSVAVLANRDDVDAAEVAYRIADIYLSDRPAYRPDPDDKSAPGASELAAYAGNYELYPGIIFQLRREGDGLSFTHMGRGQPASLPALSRKAFQLDAARNLSLVFDPPVKGHSNGVTYQIGLNGALPARRIELAPFDASGVALSDFAGRYASVELRTEYQIVLDSGSLVIRHPRRPAIRLLAYQKDLFMAIDETPARLHFRRNESGQIAGFDLSIPLAESIEFAKVN